MINEQIRIICIKQCISVLRGVSHTNKEDNWEILINQNQRK